MVMQKTDLAGAEEPGDSAKGVAAGKRGAAGKKPKK